MSHECSLWKGIRSGCDRFRGNVRFKVGVVAGSNFGMIFGMVMLFEEFSS